MTAPTTRQDGSPYYSKSFQIACAVPAALIWLLLASLAAFWWIGFGIASALGKTGGGDWRLPYLMVVCALALGMAVFEAALFLRAVRGRSYAWPHIMMLAAGILFFGLMGIVGD